MLTVVVAAHPLFYCAAFETRFPQPLGHMSVPESLVERLADDGSAAVMRSEPLRLGVRDMLRHGGYKPTGRGKPSSEYLVRAAGEGKLGSINLLVDACNATSLHSGLPISVVDVELAASPFHVSIAEAGTRYVFNRSGQEIDVSGLLCLFDENGPCANAVKDAQRTKTHEGTRTALAVVWGLSSDEERTTAAAKWYRELLERAGASTQSV
jgi:DNA/RNA-binding domain of Phe-tRNA-synthetase-like protein